MSSVKNGTEQALQQFGNESQVPQQLGAYITCLIIAYTGVALRFLSRHMQRTPLGTDDWLIVVSLVSSELIKEKVDDLLRLTLTSTKFFTTGFTCISISLIRDGLGRHVKFVTNPKLFALVQTPSPACTVCRNSYWEPRVS